MISEIAFYKLEPSEGYWLTQANTSDEEHTFSKLIICGVKSVKNWKEVDDEYKQQWEATFTQSDPEITID